MKIHPSRIDREMPVLVTGGAGVIGSSLVRILLEFGCRVTVLDDLSSGRLDNLPESPQLTVIIGSILSDDPLARAFDNSPAYVFHLAAQFANQNSVEHPFTDLLANAGGTVRVLESARRVSGLGRVVIASSSCVYGSAAGVISEDAQVQPITPYAISKLASENYGIFYHRFYGVPVTVLRYFNVYGPGERPGIYRNVVPNFFDRALRKLPLLITGTGDETRTFTYVTDIVEGTIRASLSGAANGRIFNLGSESEVKIIQIAESINRMTGNPVGIEFRDRRCWDDVARRASSCAQAKEVFGYQPQVNLQEGLGRTYQWFVSERISAGPAVTAGVGAASHNFSY